MERLTFGGLWPPNLPDDCHRGKHQGRHRQDDTGRAIGTVAADRWPGCAADRRRPAGIGPERRHDARRGRPDASPRLRPACRWQAATGAARPAGGKHDDTIIDAGGRDNEALRVALLRSDLLVVPVQPRAVDVWALSDIADLIDRAQEAREDEGRPPLRVLAVLNLADPGDNRDTAETVEALAGFPQFTVAAAIIRRRKAVANAMAHGLSVAELTAARSQGVRGNRATG